ncbi:MAG: hypothetical protein QOF11_2103 [Chloroflexota bacterium]|nr:hypothetical protein [Chloroflexota bacterium]
MVASTLTGERGRRVVPGGLPARTALGGGRSGRAVRVGLGTGQATRSATALTGGAAIFWGLRGERPTAWRRKTFRRWVELFRTHLAPIASLDMLADSFAREAVLPVEPGDGWPEIGDRMLASPLLAAYVVRWLELRDGELLESWRALVGEGVRRGAVAPSSSPARRSASIQPVGEPEVLARRRRRRAVEARPVATIDQPGQP